jgi:mannosyltransferase PIG-V
LIPEDSAAPELGLPVPGAAGQIAAAPVGAVASLKLSGERRDALRDVLAAFFSSRAVVWAAGIAAVLLLGWKQGAIAQLDHAHLTMPFHQTIGNLAVAPATRWDSAWYLSIARTGYVLSAQTVFFPLYPGLIALGGSLVGHGLDVVVGIVISCCCALGALYLLHRLVALEFDERLARNTVWIFAWLPIALVLSAVYSEALFLLLAIGCLYAARRSRWALAGLLGGLAAATRNGGVLLVVPLLILYLYGPRPDRTPDREGAGLAPRYNPRRDMAWIALVPLGLLAYMAYLLVETGQPLDPFTHQLHWGRHFIPLAGIPLGAWSVGRALFAATGLDPRLSAHVTLGGQLRHIVEFGFLVIALALLRLCWKRLPLAYFAFAALSLAMAVSVPTGNDPLKSLPRFTLVMFPLWIALALWATERRRVREVIAVCAPLLALASFLFVSWSWPP